MASKYKSIKPSKISQYTESEYNDAISSNTKKSYKDIQAYSGIESTYAKDQRESIRKGTEWANAQKYESERQNYLKSTEALENNAKSDENFESKASESYATKDWFNTLKEQVSNAYRTDESDSILEKAYKTITAPVELAQNLKSNVETKLGMTDEQKQVYNYYAETDREKANAYLESISDESKQNLGTKISSVANDIADEGNKGVSIGLGWGAGLNQYATGVANTYKNVDGLILDEEQDYYDTDAITYASNNIRTALGEDADEPTVFGSTLGQFAYDAVTSIANMTPSLVTSAIGGGTIGSVAGNVVMASGVYGNAYQQKRSEGQDKGRSALYATVNSALEVGLNYLFAGIKALSGGKGVSTIAKDKIVSKVMSKIDSESAKIIADYGIDFVTRCMGEFGDEFTQEVLEPIYTSLIFKEDSDSYGEAFLEGIDQIDWGQAVYNGLIGFFTSAMFNSVTNGENGEATPVQALVDLANTSKLGKNVRDAGDESVYALIDEGLASDKESDSYKYASQILDKMSTPESNSTEEPTGKKVSNYELGRLTKANDEAIESERSAAIESANEKIDSANLIEEDKEKAKEIANAIIDKNLNVSNVMIDNLDVSNEVKDALKVSIGDDVDKQSVKKITNIDKNGNVEVELDDGTVVDVDKANIRSKDAEYISAIATLGYDTEASNSILLGMRTNKQTPDANTLIDIDSEIKMGYKGATDEMASVSENNFYPEQKKYYREIGRKLNSTNTKKLSSKSKVQSKSNGVEFNTLTKYSIENIENMTDKRRASSILEADALSKVVGGRVIMFESKPVEVTKNGKTTIEYQYEKDIETPVGTFKANTKAENAFFDSTTGDIYIDMNAGNHGEGTILYSFAHELTHKIRRNAPEEFDKLASFVINEMYKTKTPEEVETLIKTQWLRAKEANPNVDITYDYAYEEFIADSLETMLTSKDTAAHLENLYNTNKSLWQKFVDLLKKFKDAFEKAFKQYENLDTGNRTNEGEIVYNFSKDAYKKLSEMYAEALKIANEVDTIVYEDANFVDSIETENGVKNQLRKSEEIANNSIEFNKEHKNVSAKVFKKGAEDMVAMANVMKPYLDVTGILPEDVAGNTFMEDASYGGSMENATICPRTLVYEEFKDMVAEDIERPLTVAESLLVSQKIYDIATDPQCVYCYVAADRKAYDEYIGIYWDNMNKYITALKKGGNSKKLYKEYLNGRKDTPNQQARWKEWERIAKTGEKFVTQKDLSTQAMRDQAIARGGEIADQVRDAQRYAQSASWAKLKQGYRAYAGDILGFKEDFIKSLNSHYGLRMYSFSDYTPAFIVENMQMLLDMSARGVKSLAYTKDTDYAKIFAPTGQAINVSCFAMYDEKHGTYVEDNRQGANWAETKALREKFENVGSVMVCTNDDMVDWALHQDWIDVIIPYHIVKTGTTIAGEYGWRNFTSMSSDRAGNKAKTIYPTEHNNDFATFKKLIEERNLTPRFEQWYNKVGKELTEEEYMKLVNEVRLPASKLNPVKPIFDLDAAKTSFGIDSNGNEIPNGFVDKGGYFGGWYREGVDVNQEVKAVAQDIREGKTSLDVEYGMLKRSTRYEEYDKLVKEVEQESYKPLEINTVEDAIGVLELAGYSNFRYRDYDNKYTFVMPAPRRVTNYEGDTAKGLIKLAEEFSKDYGRLYRESKLGALVDAEAESRNLIKVYHGTNKFGFTVFDAKHSDDRLSLFTTSKKELAGTYTDFSKVKEIHRDAAQVTANIDKMPTDLVYEKYKDLRKLLKGVHHGAPISNKIEMISNKQDIQKIVGKVARDEFHVNFNDFMWFNRKDLETLSNSNVPSDVKEITKLLKDFEKGISLDKVYEFVEKFSKSKTKTSWADLQDLTPELYENIVILYGSASHYKKLYDSEIVFYDDSERELFSESQFRDIVKSKYNYLSGTTTKGIYQLYVNPTDFMVVDAMGSNWSRIPWKENATPKSYDVSNEIQLMSEIATTWQAYFWDDITQSDLILDCLPNGLYDSLYQALEEYSIADEADYFEDANIKRMLENAKKIDEANDSWNNDEISFQDALLGDDEDGDVAYYKTRDLSRIAHNKGYKGVLIKNVNDNGYAGYVGAGDLYIFYEGEQVKSADPITYDDNGNIIPLSERFDSTKNDIRWSTRNIDITPRFYSNINNVLSNVKQDKLGANSVVNMLKGKGVKDEEIKWSGIVPFLEGKKSVSRQELMDFVNANQLSLSQIVLRENAEMESKYEYEPIDEADKVEGSEVYIFDERSMRSDARKLARKKGYKNNDVAFDEYYDEHAFETMFKAYIPSYISDTGKDEILLEGKVQSPDSWDIETGEAAQYGGTNWHGYKTRGGDNYREFLFYANGLEYINRSMQTHWEGMGGVLVHARVQDFFNDDKSKTLFIEEIQSDWHNEGLSKGYNDDVPKKVKEFESKCAEFVNDYTALENKLGGYGLDKGMVVFALRNGSLARNVYEDFKLWKSFDEKTIAPYIDDFEKMIDRSRSLSDEYLDMSEDDRLIFTSGKTRSSVPDAPYRNTYTDFVLKNLMRTAADEGYDSIAWTTGKMQEQRWASDYSEGYRIEYDQDIPKFLNKYGKQWGAHVESMTMGDGMYKYVVPSIKITDSMKEGVTKGQPLFSTRNSNGGELSQNQIDFFSESAIRDNDGNLKVVYHGSMGAWFTEFDANQTASGFFYFTDNENVAFSYAGSDDIVRTIPWTVSDANKFIKDSLNDYYGLSQQKRIIKRNDGYVLQNRTNLYSNKYTEWSDEIEANNLDYAVKMAKMLAEKEGGTYITYLNVTNPFSLDCEGRDWNALPVNASGVVDTDGVCTWAKKQGYDGVIFKNINDTIKSVYKTPKSFDVYVAFEPNQVKAIDNNNPTSNNDIRYSNRIQGLESYTKNEIENIARNYINENIVSNDINAKIVDLAIHGSRNRGTARIDSDLDIVFQYEGNIREDDFFSSLNDEPLYIDDVKVDINPIKENLEDYMNRSMEYDNEILNSTRISDEEYLELAKNPEENKAKLQEMVEQAAKANGYTRLVYHGTDKFGFTVFDRAKNDYGRLGFYSTNNKNMAATYTLSDSVKTIKEGLETPTREDALSNVEDAADVLTKKLWNWGSEWWLDFDTIYRDSEAIIQKYYDQSNLYDGFNMDAADEVRDYIEQEYVYEFFNRLVDDGKYNKDFDFDDLYDTKEGRVIYDALNEYKKAIADNAPWMLGEEGVPTGIYQLYVNPSDFMEIDAKGRFWDDIDYTYKNDKFRDLSSKNKDVTKMRKLARELDKWYWDEEIIEEDMLDQIRTKGGVATLSLIDSVEPKYAKAFKQLVECMTLYDKLIGDNEGVETGDITWAVDGLGDLENTINEAIAETKPYVSEEYITKRMRTHEFPDVAASKGYKGVHIINVNDNGYAGYAGTGDVYIFFDSSQAKSADPVTYDDNGNVIPLSERFSSSEKDIRYSLREDFDVELEKVLNNDKYYQNNAFVLGGTPMLLTEYGFDANKKLTITPKHLKDALAGKNESKHTHGISVPEFKKAFYQMENPALLIYSPKNNGVLVAITTAVDEDNIPVGIYVKPDGTAFINNVRENTTHTVSIYGRNNTSNFISQAYEDKRVVFENKKRIKDLERILGVQFSDSSSISDSETIISQENSNVNNGADIYYSQRGVMSNERLDYEIQDSSAGTRKDYAQNWIATISTNAFIELTTSERYRGNREKFDNELPTSYGKNMASWDFLNEIKTNRQTPYLIVDYEHGEIIGHEGRHRIRALEQNGITQAEILVMFYDGGGYKDKSYNLVNGRLESISEMRIKGQFDDKQSGHITNIVPLNEDHREEVFEKHGENTIKDALEFADANLVYSIRKTDPPKNTKIGYKVFFTKNGKLYPPMVANPNGEDTPIGVWLNADVGQLSSAVTKTGRKQVKAGGKGTQGGSGNLAFRPGWHLGEIPLATQFDRLNPNTGVKELFPKDFVWAECEVAADIDYQDEAMSYGYTKNGKFNHSYAGLPKVPENGYYMYRTNPNPETLPWIITGAMKVTRLLSDNEVNNILVENGYEPKERQGGNKTLAELGLKPSTRDVQKHVKDAKEIYGVTNDYHKAGYLTIDGAYLNQDNTGNRVGLPNYDEEYDYHLDHTEIAMVYSEKMFSGEGDSWDAVNWFVNEGNIRLVNRATGSVLLQFGEVEPTKIQYQKIDEIVENSLSSGKNVGIDFSGGTLSGDYINYDKYTKPSQIVADIKYYYLNGKPRTKFSTRDTNTPSNRTILANTLMSAAQNDIEKGIIERYQSKIDDINAMEKELAEVKSELKDLSFAKGKRDTKRINELRDKQIKLTNNLNTADGQLLKIEASSPLKKLVEREKLQVLKNAESKGREAIRQAKIDKTEAIARKQEKDKLQKFVLDTSRWITSPKKSETPCPDFLKEPMAELVESINISSKRLLNGGAATDNDRKIQDAMTSLAEKVLAIQNMQNPNKDTETNSSNGVPEVDFYAGYLDLPVEFVSDLLTTRDAIKNLIKYSEQSIEGSNVMNQMTSTEIKDLIKNIKMLRKAINDMSKLYANSRYERVDDLSRDMMAYCNSLKASNGESFAKRFLNWDNTLPYYAFEKLGDSGKALFEEFMDALDKEAFLSDEIYDFQEKTWKGSDAGKWSTDYRTLKLSNGKEIELSISQAMSIYCLSKRGQATGHIMQGGIKIVGHKKKVGEGVTPAIKTSINENDVQNIINLLSPEQIKVADAIQEFMSKRSAKWINEVSQKRFLVDIATEEFYFPIESDKNTRRQEDPSIKGNDMFRLLNISATKPLVFGANNRIVIRDIFEVFAAHTSDTAKLNAYGMALLDYMKWINYREKVDNLDEQGSFDNVGVRESLDETFGGTYAQDYFMQLIKDINGSQVVKENERLMKLVRNYKVAQVAANVRVAALQPTSIIRASAVLSPSAMTYAFRKTPQIKKAQKYCGIVKWKSFGYFDTDISRNIVDRIRDSGNRKEKILEWALKGAEMGDQFTLGALWNACEYEIMKTHKYKVGTEEFNIAVGKKLREVVYRTQVVDSVLTRSAYMRNKSFGHQTTSAFMSEPTLSYNLLLDAETKFNQEYQRTGSTKLAKEKFGRYVTKSCAAYVLTALVSALVESFYDTIRDDDDDETFVSKYLDNLLLNLVQDVNPLNKIPYYKDVVNAIGEQFGIGYFSTDRLELQYLKNVSDSIKIAMSLAEKRDESYYTYYALIYKVSQAVSQFSGYPISSALREAVTTWNNTIGLADEKYKIEKYR